MTVEAASMKVCPDCMQDVNIEARLCPWCQWDFIGQKRERSVESQVTRAIIKAWVIINLIVLALALVVAVILVVTGSSP